MNHTAGEWNHAEEQIGMEASRILAVPLLLLLHWIVWVKAYPI